MSVLLLLITLWAGSVTAAPGRPQRFTASRAQNVDYLSGGAAQSLDVGIDVLVPASVPAPFGGAPQIEASSGYYSLYWMVPGTPATFLQVSGTAGGSLPAGSPADLNNELSINASVRGADAIHDVTSIYDNVWWIEGGVLYEVSSLNMTGADTMGLADSLISLQAPSGDSGGGTAGDQTPAGGDQSGTGGGNNGQASVSVASAVPSDNQATVVVGGVSNATLTATDGIFVDTGSTSYPGIGSQSVEWTSPTTAQDETVTFTLTDPATGATLATGQIVVSGSGQASNTGDSGSPKQTQTATEAPPPPATTAPTAASTAPATAVPTEAQATVTVQSANTGQGGNAAPPLTGGSSTTNAAPAQTPAPTAPASLRESGANVLSDGTEGPPPPVYAGDGTGGSYTVTLPVRRRADQ